MLYTELTITFQSRHDAFPSVILGDLLLRSYITGKLRTHFLVFC